MLAVYVAQYAVDVRLRVHVENENLETHQYTYVLEFLQQINFASDCLSSNVLPFQVYCFTGDLAASGSIECETNSSIASAEYFPGIRYVSTDHYDGNSRAEDVIPNLKWSLNLCENSIRSSSAQRAR